MRERRRQMQQMMITKPMKRARAMPTMSGMGAWSSTSMGVVDPTAGQVYTGVARVVDLVLGLDMADKMIFSPARHTNPSNLQC